MADWSKHPLAMVAENVRGETTSAWGRTTWDVDSDGILQVIHRNTDGESTTLTFRLVEVKQTWVEVNRD